LINKALFLDRDGVINLDHGHVHRIVNFEFVDGIFELLKYAQQKDYLLIIITNQAGIGRGLYSEKTFANLNSWMCDKFLSEEIVINHVYYCPSHPHLGVGVYKKNDFRRKPSPGMILDAEMDFDLDLKMCVLVGDNKTDMEAGVAAGVGCNLLLNSKDELNHDTYKVVSRLADVKRYL
jgi:D-glycero-D-manno-heptose 1,7-bisphosphate phosphatase